MNNEKIFILTDGCMWEINEEIGNEHPHAVEVVDIETGAVRYIKSGSRIKFIEGEITDIRSQSGYNKTPKETQIPETQEMSSNTENKPYRTTGEGLCEIQQEKSVVKGI